MKIFTTLLFAFISPLFCISQSSTASAQLDIGTVVTTVHADGSISKTKLKSNGKHINYATDLWLSGTNPNGQLCFAAQMYSQSGVDYVPGPISNDPNAFAKWNKVWKINKSTVDSFSQGLFNGLVPPIILNWPAHGDTNMGESFYLAPFHDKDNDHYYNPFNGDYPCFPGDQAIFFMFNEDTIHGNVETPSLGAEILGLAYSYHSTTQEPFLDSVVFVNYSIRSKKQNLTNFKAGIFTDFDLGTPNNDMFGSDVDNNAAIVYNRTAEDTAWLGMGPNPVTAGIIIRDGLRADKGDGLDNDKDGCSDGVMGNLGNCIPESDSANVHEYWKMTSHIAFFNAPNALPTSSPSSAAEYNNILSGLWKDGVPISIENPSGLLDSANGDGYETTPTGSTTKFIFPGNSYQSSGSFEPVSPQNWFQSPSLVGDFRSVIGCGQTGLFKVDQTHTVKVAFFIAQDNSSIQNLDAAQRLIENINNYPEDPPICSSNGIFNIAENKGVKVNISPIPANQHINISIPEKKNAQIVIYNSLGAHIKTMKLSEEGGLRIDVANWPAGLYLLEIDNQIAKFVVSSR